MMSSPPSGPVRPRNVFCPASCCSASSLNYQDVVGPSRERAGGFTHVALGVVADAHREQLQELAPEVLVGVRLDVLAVVQIHQHGGILEEPDEQLAEVAGCVRPEHQILPEHHAVVAHLVLAGREVAVPEQRELLLERPPGRQHPVRPPQAKALCFDAVGDQAVEELVHHRLEPALGTRRQHLLAQTLPALARQTHGFRTARRKRIHAGIPDA